MANFQLDNDEINRAVALVLGLPRNDGDWTTDEQEDARAIIRAGLRKFFHPVTPNGSVHQWRFLERQFSLGAEAVYSTGTLTVVAGVATLAGGTFPLWADDGLIRIAGQTYYVASRDNDTQVTLQQTGLAADAGTTYELHRWRFPLPADFGEFIDGMVYSNGNETCLLQGATEHEIRLRHGMNFRTGRTRMYAVVAGDDPTAQRWYTTFWPTMDPSTFLTGTYRAVPQDNLNADITADGTVVQIDAVHAETLLAAIMAAGEEYMNDEPNGVHSQRYLQRLQQSIQHDRHAKGPIGFNNLNKNINQRAYSLFNHVPIYNDLLP